MAAEAKQIIRPAAPAAVAAKPEFIVESHIPVPVIRGRVVFPFAQMKEGDSFALHKDQKSACKGQSAKYGKEHGIRFVVADQGGITRCWHAGKRDPQ